MDTNSIIQAFESLSFNTTRTIILGGLSLLLFLCITRFFPSKQKRKSNQLSLPPAVPGIPLVGNLLQLTERKPHMTFTKWAETYGSIYTIRTGASTMVVLNSVDVAKEAMVTRYSSISSRKLSNAITLLSLDKSMVIVSDYNDFHKMAKRHIITNVLGANAQKRHRRHRDTMIENIVDRLHAHVKSRPVEAVNFRDIFQSELFGLAMKQAVGREVESLYIEELGTTWSKNDIFRALVLDFMEGSIDVDWRDFFPYLRWIPNKSFERKIEGICSGRRVVMKALIAEGKKRIEMGERRDCFMDYLLSEEKTLTEDQLLMLVWEEIIETSDTSIVTTEWAMFELARDKSRQERLVLEIENVCGSNKLSEENLAQIPYLGVVFHETLRRYSPGPIIPLRYVHEDTQLGGYFIPAGSQIAINIYGCNMDKKLYDNPEEWRPERYLDAKYDPADMFKTMSFGAGKRVCAGTLQAMLVVCTTIGRLVQEFDWNLKSGETENIDTVAITTRKLEPLHAVLKPRVK